VKDKKRFLAMTEERIIDQVLMQLISVKYVDGVLDVSPLVLEGISTIDHHPSVDLIMKFVGHNPDKSLP